MIITIDHEFDGFGKVVGFHRIDTSDPNVQAMFTALKGDPVAIAKAGYGDVTKLPAYQGKTRWEVILEEVIRLDDKTARPLLGV